VVLLRKVDPKIVEFFNNKLKALWQEGVDFSVLWVPGGKEVRVRLLTPDLHRLGQEDKTFAQITDGAKELDGVKIEPINGARETVLVFKVA